MIIDIIKNYKGNFIYDSSSIFNYDDLKSSMINYANVLENKINDHENIVIYSDYNFYSICLLIFLTKFNVNIIPIIKTTQSEYEIKIKECFLESFNVDYSTSGGPAFFDDTDGSPVTTTVAMQFKETELMTRQSIAQGY